MLVGVPGSGKTWITSQLRHMYNVIEHEEHDIVSLPSRIKHAVHNEPKAVLVTCPFGEGRLRTALEALGVPVIPVFIIEAATTVKTRYEARDRIHIPAKHLTRASTIINRATEWQAVTGTSQEILEWLRNQSN